MAIIVQKFGGSSVADPEKLKTVAERIAKRHHEGDRIVVVVSAMGKTTDNLMNLARQVHPNPPTQKLDLLLSTGELISVALLCMAIERFGCATEGLPGFMAGICTDNNHTQALIQKIDITRIFNALEENKVVIIAGFQGISLDRNITTLGRGGSDLTAMALASALKADKCEIYTDVKGVFTTDPHLIPTAKIIPTLAYEEMLEMAASGAKVMQSRAVEVAQRYKVPFEVRSTFSEERGTMIKEIEFKEGSVVSSAILDEQQAKITFFNVPDTPGVAATIFGALGEKKINVDMIVQNVSHGDFADMSFTVSIKDLDEAMTISKNICKDLGCSEVLANNTIAKIIIIGIGMMHHPGVAARMFKALSSAKINIQMISTSEIRIACLVDKAQGKRALEVVHKEFFE